jgi:hypothetical protein
MPSEREIEAALRDAVELFSGAPTIRGNIILPCVDVSVWLIRHVGAINAALAAEQARG